MTSATEPKTIDLYGVGIQNEAAVTDAVITPGMLVTRTATGIRPHNVAGGAAAPAYAVENDLIGEGIDDDYAIGENAIYRTFAQGSDVYALLAPSQTIAVGALLQSNGDGKLIVAAAADNVVAQAVQAVTTGVGVTSRIKVEILTGTVAA